MHKHSDDDYKCWCTRCGVPFNKLSKLQTHLCPMGGGKRLYGDKKRSKRLKKAKSKTNQQDTNTRVR